MSRRQVRKMLRRMAGGEPVEVVSGMASIGKVAYLAGIAQQFGYAYADTRWGGGAQDRGITIVIVPDLSPQARARAAQNWALYPRAADTGVLPPPPSAELRLLKLRITCDLATVYTTKQRVLLYAAGMTALCVTLGIKLGADHSGAVIGGGIWAGLMALLPVGLITTRRHTAKLTAELEAAGFTPVTDAGGRLRYVQRGRGLPGHGNPFAGGA